MTGRLGPEGGVGPTTEDSRVSLLGGQGRPCGAGGVALRYSSDGWKVLATTGVSVVG